ncbi:MULTISPECIES: hypothetical protein [unclassified Parafrankia]|uniref:hypothetical protein n=1 Tax=Parafrankia TaxID=2994362 RepID=UPI000DA46C82|nr:MULTISPECIES: hypothetical protein [unclassified Parafrankia]TCJ33357.1 hypothetical protein E0504_38250 [Parafrankia sp. BMG5.11]SQD98153.1 conserved hypothetical protein [Parafrankia sp. Ea1.12]SQD98164.1 conserved hypothetical protein [Parafrankia sp. Ea1.12]
MDAFRRGWVGLALFLAALIMMPVLVVEYHSRLSDDARYSGVDAESIIPPVTSTAPPRTAPPGVIVGFNGVLENETLRGFRHISLETTGDIGEIHYTLTGPTGSRYPMTVSVAPYLFAPHQTGWETSAVMDGVYSLEARAERPGVPARSITFTIQNSTPADAGAGAGAAAGVGAGPVASRPPA